MPSDQGSKGRERYKYLIIRSERAGFGDLWRFFKKGDTGSESGTNFIESSFDDHEIDDDQENDDDALMKWGVLYGIGGIEERWVILVSVIVRKVLALLNKPLEWIGYFVEFFLNLISLNGNLFGLFFNVLQGKTVIPQRGSTTFMSSTGFLDQRMNLYEADKPSNNGIDKLGSRSLMDLCIMASKLSYENDNVVQDVVLNLWKMHFVGFYNCWNDYQKRMSTQVFILCDKPTDASLILISFRGTKPFDANDWSTDFDYSWYKIPELGRIHVGFLEALGLGSRTDTTSFQHHLQVKDIELASSDSPKQGTISSPDMAKSTAYDIVKSKVKELLALHPNAKFVVTGHSLGGALAILFPTVLVLHEEKEMMEKLQAVYTFGQPRVADSKLGKFMETQLNEPVARYFRVVYCNDVVPRLPYDNNTFLYKHFGVCLYYNCFYSQQKVDEQPNRNYYGMKYLIPAHVNAAWELIRAFGMRYMYGSEYKENWCSIMLRVVGLALPGLSAHSPRDYVNSVRLGRENMLQMPSFE